MKRIAILVLLCLTSITIKAQCVEPSIFISEIFGSYQLQKSPYSNHSSGFFTKPNQDDWLIRYFYPTGNNGEIENINLILPVLATTQRPFQQLISLDVSGEGDYEFMVSSYVDDEDEFGNFFTNEKTYITNNGVFDFISEVAAYRLHDSGNIDNLPGDEVIIGSSGQHYVLQKNGSNWERTQITTLDKINILVDLDNDGLDDIVSWHIDIPLTPIELKVRKNLGNLQFEASPTTIFQTVIDFNTYIHSSDLIYADLNSDNFQDILISYTKNNEIVFSWFENDGNGNLGLEKVLYTTPYNIGGNRRNIRVADMNQDGFMDVVAGVTRSTNILLNNTNNEWDYFCEFKEIDIPFEIIDLNNDQFPDIVGSGFGNTVINDALYWQPNTIGDSTSTINGIIYQDINESNSYESSIDIVIPFARLDLNNGDSIIYADEHGYYNFKINNAGNYLLSAQQNQVYNCDFTELVQSSYTNPANGQFAFNYVKYAEIEQNFGLTAATITNNCTTFSGIVFNDGNANGMQDNGELGLNGILVNAGNQSIFTNQNGYYEFELSPDQTVEINIDTTRPQNIYCNSNSALEQTFPSSPDYYTVSSNLPTTNLNFGLNFQRAHEVGLYALNVLYGNQPGATFHAWMDFKSQGEQSTPCTLRIEHNPLLSLLDSAVPTSNVSSDFVEWIFAPNTLPDELLVCMNMQWHLDSSAVEGDTLHWEASYECPPAVDPCPNNNLLVRDVIIGSGGLRLQNNRQQIYSMNAAGEMPYELDLEDSIFSYVINFQNTLATPANNIIIIDTLPEGVVANSISKPFSSHDYDFRLVEPNIAIWEFKNINLPNVETDELNSYGFVQFNVLRKNDLPIGTVIENKGCILYNNSTWGTTNEVKHIIPDYYPPTALCNEAFEIFLDENGQASITADLIDAGSSDNVGVESLALNQTDFDCADIGDFSIVLSVKDGAQNLDSCSTAIVIKDSLPPTITCTDLDISINTGETYSIQDDINAFTNSDNCGVQGITANQIEFTDGDEGDNAITISIEDDNGNSMDCAINVRIEVVTSILESQYGIELTIAPNPAKDFVRLNFSRALPFNYNVDLIAVNGQIVKSKINLSSTSVELERGNLASGVYFVQVRNSESLERLANIKVILE